MKYRTLFFSDLHLGSSAAKAEAFVQFLKDNQFEKIYAVGDIVDFWALQRKTKGWTESHNEVVRRLLKAQSKGVDVCYIFGNHDEVMEKFVGERFGGVYVKKTDIHTAADGKTYLIIHGHQLDAVMRIAPWLAHWGTVAYDILLWINGHFNGLRKLMGLKYWSLSSYLKLKVKSAVNHVSDYEKGIVDYAKQHGTYGVICGHIHCPAMHLMDNVVYINDGDLCESLTAAVEDYGGNISIINVVTGDVLATTADLPSTF